MTARGVGRGRTTSRERSPGAGRSVAGAVVLASARRSGPGAPIRPVVLVPGSGPIHTDKLTAKAPSERPWLTVGWLPKHALEFNEIEPSWHAPKRHPLAHRTFADADVLDSAVHRSVSDMNQERRRNHSCDNPRIAA